MRELFDIASDLSRMLDARKSLHRVDAIFAEAEKELRDQILVKMQADSIKTADHASLRIARRQGARVVVTSRVLLEAALIEAGLMEECQRTVTDANKAKSLGIEHELAGVERVPYDELVVTPIEGGAS